MEVGRETHSRLKPREFRPTIKNDFPMQTATRGMEIVGISPLSLKIVWLGGKFAKVCHATTPQKGQLKESKTDLLSQKNNIKVSSAQLSSLCLIHKFNK